MGAPLDTERADARVGSTLAGRYFVNHLLGSGGMGDVYQATDLVEERVVAVKLLRRSLVADPTLVQRFGLEVRAAGRLRHPHTIEVHDFGRLADGTPYLVAEFVPGRTLAQVIAEDWPLEEARTIRVGAQLLSALQAAHEAGIVHRDLKPANLLLDPRDGLDFVKVLDFGIATLSEPAGGRSRLTERGQVYGTPAYMSPEQVRGEPLDARSDLYAVGVLLYEMIAGLLPFDAPTPMGIAAQHLAAPPPPPSSRRREARVTPALEALVLRALAKRPADRPGTAASMREELLACLALQPAEIRQPRTRTLPPTAAFPGMAGAEEPGPPAPRSAARSSRGRLWAAAAITAGALALLGWRLLSAPPGAADGGSATPAVSVLPAPRPPEPMWAIPAAAAPLDALPAGPTSSAPRLARTRARAAPAPPAPAPARPAIRLVRGELNSVPTPPAATGDGVLVVEATPWAEISVDGEPLGETPREVRIRAGNHTVRAVHPVLGAQEADVAVRAGERRFWAPSFSP